GRPSQSFTARGRVVDAQTGKPLPGRHELFVSHHFDKGGHSGHVGTVDDDQVKEDGSFEIAGLLPGRFFASVVYKGDTDLYSDNVEFQIDDADVGGLQIKAYHGFTVTGVVDLEGAAPPDALAKRAQLKLEASSAITHEGSAWLHHDVQVNPDGTFRMLGLPRGPIEISSTFCGVCSYFAMERIELPPDANGEVQTAGPGHASHARVI